MNLTNKTIDVDGLAVSSSGSQTTVQVSVLVEVASGVFQRSASYNLTLDDVYLSTEDPNLLATVVSKLEALP
jgi:hypothetical protein